MQVHNNTKLYQEERMWFFTALGLLCLLFAAYMYFVSASIVHVVMRKEISQEIAQVSSQVSQLEARYIEAQHSVSDEIASQHGYTKVAAKTFIDREASTLVLETTNR